MIYIDDNETPTRKSIDIHEARRYPEDDVLHFAALIAEKRIGLMRNVENNIDRLASYCMKVLGHLEFEVFTAIWLDENGDVIFFDWLFVGDYSGCSVHPIVCVQRAVEVGASQVCFVHQHPSQNCSISQADEAITNKLDKALELVNVRLVEHLVVSSSSYSRIIGE